MEIQQSDLWISANPIIQLIATTSFINKDVHYNKKEKTMKNINLEEQHLKITLYFEIIGTR
jgi:hypothetical protein